MQQAINELESDIEIIRKSINLYISTTERTEKKHNIISAMEQQIFLIQDKIYRLQRL